MGDVLLAAVTVAAFAHALHAAPVWDDEFIATRNPYLSSAGGLWHLATSDLWVASAKGEASGYYRPLGAISLALNRWIGGNTSASYHLGNILLHAACAVAVRRWLSSLAGHARSALPWACALVFALLPVNSEAVVWIVGRFDLLGTLLAVCALLANRRQGRVGLVVLSYAGAILCKEPYLMVPALLFLDDVLVLRRRSADMLTKYAALVVTTALYFGVRRVLHVVSDSVTAGSTLWGAVGSYVVTVGILGRATLDPATLSLFHVYRPSTAGVVAAGAAALLAVTLLLAAWGRVGPLRLSARGGPGTLGRVALLGWLWTLAALLPAGLGAPHLFQLGDRYAYFPSIGLLMVLFAGASALGRRARALLSVAAVSAAASFVPILAARLDEWRSPERLYEAELARDPSRYWARLLLGELRAKQGRYGEAETELLRAKADASVPWRMDVALCYVYLNENRPDDAVTECKTALAWNANDPRAWINLGYTRLVQRHYAAALHDADHALEHKPHYADGHYVKALALANMGRLDEARAEARAALADDPGHAGARDLLAKLDGGPR